MQCATYVYDAYYSAKIGTKTIISSYLFNAIPALGKRATSSYTVPQYAALAGEYTREQYNYKKEKNKKIYTTIKAGEKPANDGQIGDCVLMVVSINVGEGIKVKMPGSTQFKLIEGTENESLSKQLQYVLDSGILVENDIVYFVSEEGTNSKTNQGEYYPPDIGQVHVGVMATVDTYSAANGYVFRKPIVEAVDTYVGMDFIILNTDIETIELMRTLYGDGGIQ